MNVPYGYDRGSIGPHSVRALPNRREYIRLGYVKVIMSRMVLIGLI